VLPRGEIRWELISLLRQGKKLRRLGAVRVDRCQCGFNCPARKFQIGEHLGRTVLQGLERANHLVELNPHLEVVECNLEGLQVRAQHLCGDAGTGTV